MFWDTALPNEAGNQTPHGGLVFAAIGGNESKYVAMLDDVPQNRQIPFDEWWNLYDYKVDRSPKLEKKWEKLTDAERIRAMEHTARYVKSQPDKKYRKNPETYLSNKSFNNEIIEDNGKSNGNRKTGYGIGSVPSTVEKADTLVIRVDELGDIEF